MPRIDHGKSNCAQPTSEKRIYFRCNLEAEQLFKLTDYLYKLVLNHPPEVPSLNIYGLKQISLVALRAIYSDSESEYRKDLLLDIISAVDGYSAEMLDKQYYSIGIQATRVLKYAIEIATLIVKHHMDNH